MNWRKKAYGWLTLQLWIGILPRIKSLLYLQCQGRVQMVTKQKTPKSTRMQHLFCHGSCILSMMFNKLQQRVIADALYPLDMMLGMLSLQPNWKMLFKCVIHLQPKCWTHFLLPMHLYLPGIILSIRILLDLSKIILEYYFSLSIIKMFHRKIYRVWHIR